MTTIDERVVALETAVRDGVTTSVRNDVKTVMADVAVIKARLQGVGVQGMHLGQKYWWVVGLGGLALGFIGAKVL